ncbi:MAG: dynamin family protein [Nitrospirae bacterium YQR-1]
MQKTAKTEPVSQIAGLSIRQFLSDANALLARIAATGASHLNERTNALLEKINNFTIDPIKIALVGITSSGKSSILNVLLGTGERILREQCKATTNVMVVCEKASETTLEVHFNSGHFSQYKNKDEFLSLAALYSSEDKNPHNKFDVKYLKISMSTVLLDEGVEIIDTPGLDAFKLKEHEDLTLREFLPNANIILYLSPIRSQMKEPDRKMLDRLMEKDQKIIFVQTGKGYVVDRNYGDGKVDDIWQQTEKSRQDLEIGLQSYSKLKNSPIVQVETTSALEYFATNDDSLWKDSGFDDLLDAIRKTVDAVKREFVLNKLRRLISEISVLNNLIKDTLNNEDTSERSKYIETMKNYCNEIISEEEFFVSKWSKMLDYKQVYNNYRAVLEKTYSRRYDYNPAHDEEFIEKSKELFRRTLKIKDTFLTAMDEIRVKYREYFDTLGLEVRRTDIQKTLRTEMSLPEISKKSVSYDDAGAVSGSRFNFLRSVFSKDKDRTLYEYIDKTKYYEDLKDSLKAFFDPLLNHLHWWNNLVTYTFMEPLQTKIGSFEKDNLSLEQSRGYAQYNKHNLISISEEIKNITSKTLNYIDSDVVPQLIIERNLKPMPQLSTKKLTGTSLFTVVYNNIKDAMFLNYYLKTVSQISQKLGDIVILLVGHEHKLMIDFIARLYRLSNDEMQQLEEMVPPFGINTADMKFRYITFDKLKGLSFYVFLNNNRSLIKEQKERIFDRADVVQVIVEDLHRVGSAISDMVERHLFYRQIYDSKHKLLLTYPKAAYFQKDRLHIMFNEAIEEVNKVFLPDSVKWFFYENYEIRYNYFNDIAAAAIKEKILAEESVRRWKSYGIPMDANFSEKILKTQFEAVTDGI